MCFAIKFENPISSRNVSIYFQSMYSRVQVDKSDFSERSLRKFLGTAEINGEKYFKKHFNSRDC